jgi:hypothetical protein
MRSSGIGVRGSVQESSFSPIHAASPAGESVSAYWITRTAASAARLYWESLGDVTRRLEGPLEPGDRVDAPAGCTVFPHELQRPTRDEAAARFTDIRHWSEPERGGHFPAARAAADVRGRGRRLLRAGALTRRHGAALA